MRRRFAASRRTRMRPCRSQRRRVSRLIPSARAVYFRDPERNIVEFLARHEPRRHLTLAEVGLPVADVADAVTALRKLGLEPYRAWGETFAPLGDADGLLIVVQVGRGWFPYDEPAGTGAIHVTVAGAHRGEVAGAGRGD